MIHRAYYNEKEPYAVAWLRNLIAAGHIMPGDVDNRSIEDVTPSDLAPYTQCHFFAGIGVWSYALRLAGWPDDRPVWTGSCPCQPFSAAGKKSGFVDERHLWPAWLHLIHHAKPASVPVYGEQVASKDGLAWFDLVSADLEGSGNTVRAVDLCVAGVGGPHIRQRLFFVANANERTGEPSQPQSSIGAMAHGNGKMLAHSVEYAPCNGREQRGSESSGRGAISGCGESSILGDTNDTGLQRRTLPRASSQRGGTCGVPAGTPSVSDYLEHASRQRRERRQTPAPGYDNDGEASQRAQSEYGSSVTGPHRGPTNGFWRNAEWLPCIDSKARPVEPGTFPLAHGIANRVGRLRAYGNAISPWAAAEFIVATM